MEGFDEYTLIQGYVESSGLVYQVSDIFFIDFYLQTHYRDACQSYTEPDEGTRQSDNKEEKKYIYRMKSLILNHEKVCGIICIL